MWPFKKKKDALYAEPLNSAEADQLQQNRDAIGSLAQTAGVEVQPGSELAACDRIVVWWHSLAEHARPDPNPIVNCAGA